MEIDEIQIELKHIYSYHRMGRGDKFELIGMWLAYLTTENPGASVYISLNRRLSEEFNGFNNAELVTAYRNYLRYKYITVNPDI